MHSDKRDLTNKLDELQKQFSEPMSEETMKLLRAAAEKAADREYEQVQAG